MAVAERGEDLDGRAAVLGGLQETLGPSWLLRTISTACGSSLYCQGGVQPPLPLWDKAMEILADLIWQLLSQMTPKDDVAPGR